MDVSSNWTDFLALKIANVLVFSVFLGSGTFAIAAPGGWASGAVTFITPGPLAFSVFSLIHFLLLGTIIWQFTAAGTKKFVEPLSYRFIALGLLTSVWVNLWKSESYIFALIASLLVAAVSSESYYLLRSNHAHGKSSAAEELFIHFPFSLWHGWSVVLVFINVFAAFGKTHSEHAGVWTKIFVFLALALLEIQAAGYAFSSESGDIGGSAVITWTLFNIFAFQTSSKFIHWSAFGFALVSSVNLLKSIYGTSTHSHAITLSEETQPILPS